MGFRAAPRTTGGADLMPAQAVSCLNHCRSMDALVCRSSSLPQFGSQNLFEWKWPWSQLLGLVVLFSSFSEWKCFFFVMAAQAPVTPSSYGYGHPHIHPMVHITFLYLPPLVSSIPWHLVWVLFKLLHGFWVENFFEICPENFQLRKLVQLTNDLLMWKTEYYLFKVKNQAMGDIWD